MTTSSACLAHLSDRELLAEVASLAARERDTTARLIASLAELDARKLYRGEGCSSLFTYCTQVLHLSEHAAYARIEAARAARKFPLILELLSDGAINLTTIGLLARALADTQHAASGSTGPSGAARPAFSSSTTSFRTRRVGRRSSRTSSCAAGCITRTSRSSTSGRRCSCGRRGRCSNV